MYKLYSISRTNKTTTTMTVRRIPCNLRSTYTVLRLNECTYVEGYTYNQQQY